MMHAIYIEMGMFHSETSCFNLKQIPCDGINLSVAVWRLSWLKNNHTDFTGHQKLRALKSCFNPVSIKTAGIL